jgi:hypothetical protein
MGGTSRNFHVWLVSALVGAVTGWVTVIEPPVPLLPAAVWAGEVTYTAGSPMAEIYARTANGVVQFIALLIRAGLSDAALSRIIYAIQSGIFSSSVALLVFGVSRNVFFSITFSLLFIIYLPFCGGAGYTDYIIIVASSATWGVIGHGLVLLVLSLVSIGQYGLAIIALAVLVTCHPVLALWTAITLVGAFLICGYRIRFANLRPLLWSVGLAALIVAPYLLVLLKSRLGAGHIPQDEAQRYLDAFITLWDGHRNQPINWGAAAQTFSISVFAVIWIRLLKRAGQVASHDGLLILFTAISGSAGLFLYLLHHLYRDAIPMNVEALFMPGRFINIPIILTAPLLVGLALRTPFATVPFLILGSVVGISVARSSWNIHPALEASIATALVIVTGALLFVPPRTRNPMPKRFVTVMAGGGDLWVGYVMLTIYATVALLYMNPKIPVDQHELLSQVKKHIRQPVLMAGDETYASLIQIFPRIQIALDVGNLDYIPYAIDSAPIIQATLRDIYGVDYFDPPITNWPGIQDLWVRRYWEGLSTQEWRRLSVAYDFKMIVTTQRWNLSAKPVFTFMSGEQPLYFYSVE